ncbi:kinase-like protein [Cystobasidium minutum MCA 4210]|uniref:kinase-like protein n=1 Tax=Cystobasidium minutum MCA 4210 TaxID=1397322 RepID=UPI0034CFC0DD|eukprot:jgi/Rhomi1/143413/e_gw1.3.954.1
MITNAPKTPVNESFPSSSSSSSSANTSTPSTQADSSSSSSTSHDAKQQALASSNYSSGNAAASTNGATTARRRGDHGSSSLKGKLTVKIIEARNLVTPEANIRPYVVATFEQNEFVSIEAINDREGDDGDIESSSPNGADTAQNGKSDSGIIENTGKASAYNPIWKHEVAFDVTLDHQPVTVCVYARRGDEEFFLGLVDIKPELKHGWQVDDWYKLHPRQDEEVTGDVHVRMRFERSEQRRTLRSSDFEFLRMIGKGTFGRVFQVRKKDTKRIYAMKVLSKREIIAKKEVQHTIGERKILQRSSECPFLLGLKFSFQSETELFLVMDFKSGGELFHHLQKEGRFTEDRARFYAAEITLAFEYLHKYHIVYRDLKPENILLDATGHIVLCDFGLSKPDLPSNALTNTFCGTTEYLAPEVLLDDHGYSQTVDFWSLGVLLFEMCCGWSPFYAEDTQQMYKNICFGKIKFPRGVIGDDGKQFVKGLLNRNPAHRLGAKRDAAELKEHPFFKVIDWEALAARQVTVPFKPYVDSDECVRNFDAEFTDADILREAPVDTGAYFDDDAASAWIDEPVDPRKQGPVPIHPSKNRLDEEAQDAFRGFSYSGDAELNDLMMSASVKDNNDDDMRY